MSNLRLWDKLGKTDPSHTKQFTRGGGFKGTAIKPQWAIKNLTEAFGPAGTGWGMNEPSFQIVNGDNREVLVYCTVSGWYIEGTEKRTVYGVGGDKVVSHIKANAQYNRPERWENDDEAFKKAYTDALMNAFKFIGVGADVHMGQFDDSKYVQEMQAEFAEKITAQQVEEIEALILDVSADRAKLLKFFGIKDIPDILADDFERVRATIEKKRPKAKAASDVLDDEIPY